MQNKKRTKQLQIMVDVCNTYLRENMVNFEEKYQHDIFNFTCGVLLNAGCYKGFVECHYIDHPINKGERAVVMIDTDTPLDERFIQIW